MSRNHRTQSKNSVSKKSKPIRNNKKEPVMFGEIISRNPNWKGHLPKLPKVKHHYKSYRSTPEQVNVIAMEIFGAKYYCVGQDTSAILSQDQHEEVSRLDDNTDQQFGT